MNITRAAETRTNAVSPVSMRQLPSSRVERPVDDRVHATVQDG
jgi:hypothetical protein